MANITTRLDKGRNLTSSEIDNNFTELNEAKQGKKVDIVNVTAAYTVTTNDLGKIINCTSGSFTVSLTAAATLGAGFNCWIWNTSNTSTGVIRIIPNGNETIDSKLDFALNFGDRVHLTSNGTNWNISDIHIENIAIFNRINSDLTISNTGFDVSALNNSGGRAAQLIHSRSPGKYYFEFLYYGNKTSSISALGVALPTISTSTPVYSSTSAWVWTYSGVHSGADGTVIPTALNASPGDIIGVAIDNVSGLLWFSKNGIWLDGGDPAAGTNPNCTNVPAEVFPIAYLYGGAENDSRNASIRATRDRIEHQIPEGFSPLIVSRYSITGHRHQINELNIYGYSENKTPNSTNKPLSVGEDSIALSSGVSSGTSALSGMVNTSSTAYGGIGANTVSVGHLSRATGNYATALGGSSNQADGTFSSVFGGNQNQALGMFSVAYGSYAVAAQYGKQAFASGRFTVAGDAQSGKMVLRRQTTNATTTVLTSNGSTAVGNNTVFIPEDSLYSFSGTVIARNINSYTENKVWQIKGAAKRNIGPGTTAFIGTPSIDLLASEDVPWNISLRVNISQGTVEIAVEGEAGKTINWVAVVDTVEVTG